jgi:hypothetical protein
MFSGLYVAARAATSLFAAHLELMARKTFCDVSMYLQDVDMRMHICEKSIFVFPQDFI